MFWLKTLCLHGSSVTNQTTESSRHVTHDDFLSTFVFVLFFAHSRGSNDTLVSRQWVKYQLWVHYHFNIPIKCDNDTLHYLNNYFNCGEIKNSIFSHLLFLPNEDILKKHIG